MHKLRKMFNANRLLLITLLISLVLSLFVLYTPKIKDSSSNSFSSVRAANHIAEISKKPHSYFDQVELEEVRTYLTDTLVDYVGAANVESFTYDVNEVNAIKEPNSQFDLDYPMVNILAKISGKSDKGILLVAHYDSRGHIGRYGELGRSYGAMDDGYGVGSLLELAYVLKDMDFENSIYFLFTDAEEIGLYGAKLAAKDPRIMDNVSFVINLESRGQTGPTYMFETSKNNAKVIDLYKKANLPVTYSLATAVYSVMPNFTDFTPFVDAGYPGLNFANLAGIKSYHSPYDTYELIDLSTIQHMGSQVEPIIKEFASNGKYIEDNYFDAPNDKIFFTLFANVLVSYSQVVAFILLALLSIAFSALLFFEIKSKTIDLSIITKTLPKVILFTVSFLVISYIYANVVAFLGKVPFNLTYVRVNGSDLPTAIYLIVVFIIMFKKVRSSNDNNVLVITTGVNLLLTILTTFVLPGASFLFAIAALFGSLLILTKYLNNKYLKQSISIITNLVLLLIIIPVLYSFYMALTVGGTLILVLILVLIGSLVALNINYNLVCVKE